MTPKQLRDIAFSFDHDQFVQVKKDQDTYQEIMKSLLNAASYGHFFIRWSSLTEPLSQKVCDRLTEEKFVVTLFESVYRISFEK